jgi:PAS domain S-box-containing protein/putative nucleotidyltransferase with HDIG domain
MGTWEYILAEGKLYWSDECAKLFGIKPGEFRGDFESFLHFVHPEDREYVFNVNQPAVELKEGMTLHYEHRIVRKDGVVRWVREEAGPVMDEDGEVTKMVGMVIDVTEQVKGENELREKTEQLRGIIESQQDLIVRIDLDGCYCYVNDAFCKISDRSRENLLGSSYVSLVHPDDLEITKHVIEGLFSKSQHDYLELRAMTIEGWRWFAWVGSAIRDINGKEIEIQGVGRDITTQKDAEAELIKIQAKLEELVKERTGELERANLNLQREIVERKKAETEIAHTLDIYRKALEGIILSMGTVMSKRDNYTAEHQLRVANLAVAIAEELGLEESRIEGLKLAAEVHDIGKISIPAEILTKPGELTDLEYMIIQTHPRSGYEILCSIDFPWPLAEIIVQHHEKIDGSGYPESLRGDEILLEAKIICLADVVEAMASHRPYRASLGINAALEEIEQQRGILYDEGVVDACLRLFRDKEFKLE